MQTLAEKFLFDNTEDTKYTQESVIDQFYVDMLYKRLGWKPDGEWKFAHAKSNKMTFYVKMRGLVFRLNRQRDKNQRPGIEKYFYKVFLIVPDEDNGTITTLPLECEIAPLYSINALQLYNSAQKVGLSCLYDAEYIWKWLEDHDELSFDNPLQVL